MKVDMEEIRKRREQGFISTQQHPEMKLFIHNYTPRCQFEKMWDEYTTMCRGLITKADGTVVARPFTKFFNLGEQDKPIPDGHFNVYDKADGSMGLAFVDVDNQWSLATRGSFTSPQAIKGTEILRRKLGVNRYLFEEGYTYIFEIVYPSNRIVVDYQGLEDVIPLTVINNETGQEIYPEVLRKFGFNPVKVYDGIKDITKLKELAEPNKEGFVIHWPASNYRLKIKYEEYKRLHSLVTRCSAKSIWELLSTGKGLQELLDHVPDEFYKWVKQTAEEIQKDYKRIEDWARFDFRVLDCLAKSYENKWTRKEWASHIVECSFPAILFQMLDGKNYSKSIWKMIRPTNSKPFHEEVDDG